MTSIQNPSFGTDDLFLSPPTDDDPSIQPLSLSSNGPDSINDNDNDNLLAAAAASLPNPNEEGVQENLFA